MKHYFSIMFLFILCNTIADGQTNANIPGPQNVLVVYNSNSGISDSVKTYYQQARGIPGANVARLDDLTEESFS